MFNRLLGDQCSQLLLLFGFTLHRLNNHLEKEAVTNKNFTSKLSFRKLQIKLSYCKLLDRLNLTISKTTWIYRARVLQFKTYTSSRFHRYLLYTRTKEENKKKELK